MFVRPMWFFFVLVVLGIACCPTVVRATSTSTATTRAIRENSLWEAGVLGGIAYLPDYPAAGQNHLKWLASPYLIYRGKILRADREGTRARFFRRRNVDSEMSFGASFKSDSEDNDARRGMPDLDYVFELGPRLSVSLSRLGGRGRLRLFLPVRAVFSTDFQSVRHRGFTSNPALYVRLDDFLRPDWIGLAQLTASFGDRAMNAFYYDVAPQYTTPERPFYDARGGYLGTDFFAGLAFPMGKRWRLFSGGQILVHSGSANAASPLFINKVNYSLVVGLSWMIYESPREAAAPL